MTAMPERPAVALGDGGDPNELDWEGCTALHLAAEAGDAKRVALLLKRGATVDVRSSYVSAWEDAYTPLAIAVRRGRGAIARALVKAGADVNAASESGDTPLLIAVREGKLDLAFWLVKAGADVNAIHEGPDDSGWSALHFAACSDRAAPLVKALLARGADPRATDPDGEIPIDVARAHRAVRVAALLKRAAARPKRPAKRKASAKAPPKRKNSALTNELFSYDLRPRRARALIAAGADVSGRNAVGETALHHVWDPLAAKVLIEAGADVNAKDQYGTTPLHRVRGTKSVGHDIAEVLIRAGAAVNGRNASRSTPLHVAALGCNFRVVELLLAEGAEIDAKNAFGQTPLANCCSGLYRKDARTFAQGIRVVRLLVARGVDPLAGPLALKGRTLPRARRAALNKVLASQRPTAK